MVERTLSMREARGSMPRFSIINSTFGVVVTYLLPMQMPRVRFPAGAVVLPPNHFRETLISDIELNSFWSEFEFRITSLKSIALYHFLISFF